MACAARPTLFDAACDPELPVALMLANLMAPTLWARRAAVAGDPGAARDGGPAGRPDLRDDPRPASFAGRTAHVAFPYGLMESTVAMRTSAEWIAALEDADIPVMPVRSTDALFADAHLAEAALFEQVATAADGSLRLPRTPIALSRTPGGCLAPAPEFDQHSREVLAAAGYGEDAVDRLL